MTADSACSATLTVRYANGGTVSRPLDISVNGKVVAAGKAFPPTGGWDTWGTVTLTVALGTGTNIVRATAGGSGGGPNLDYVEVS